MPGLDIGQLIAASGLTLPDLGAVGSGEPGSSTADVAADAAAEAAADATAVPAAKVFSTTAQLASPGLNGSVELRTEAEGLVVSGSDGNLVIPWVEIIALALVDYVVTAQTAEQAYRFSKLGFDTEPFFEHALAAYNVEVLRALFIKSAPIVEARGDYAYTETSETLVDETTTNTHAAGNKAPMAVFADCVVVLPPDLGARRIPLCFLAAVESGDYTLALTLDFGDRYDFSRLGYDTDPIALAIQTALGALRAQAATDISMLAPNLSTSAVTALAQLLLRGAAAPIGRLRQISPDFVNALEAKIAESRAGESYAAFQQLCDPDAIWVGFKPGTADSLMLWMIAPSRNSKVCAVEFAGGDDDAAATFIYRFTGEAASFCQHLNHAMEAVNFAREVVRLSDVELKEPRYTPYRMAVQRNRSLQLIRSAFSDRVIHRSTEGWRTAITEHFG
jgi:hypothetical protein